MSKNNIAVVLAVAVYVALLGQAFLMSDKKVDADRATPETTSDTSPTTMLAAS